jgi:hypothetical protein
VRGRRFRGVADACSCRFPSYVDIQDANEQSYGWSPRTLSAAAPNPEELDIDIKAIGATRVWVFVQCSKADVPRSANLSFADRKTDCNQSGFGLNGSHLGLAKLHVTHSKE